MAIATSSTDLQEARLVIDRLNHFQYYAIAVKDLFKEKSETELIQMVLQKFPQLARQLSNLEVLGILVMREE